MNEQDIQKVLWDIGKENFATLPSNFIIQRILSYGGLFLMVRAMREYGSATVKQVFEEMKPTSISARKYYYLKHFLLA